MLLLAFSLALAFFLRGIGLFRGLEDAGSFHPDTPKQVQALQNFLSGTYFWTTGSLAYDGYPYGLNHLDAYLIRVLRPLGIGLVSWATPGFEARSLPSLDELFVWARCLRVVYGMATLALLLATARRLGVRLGTRQQLLLLLAVAPVSTSVTHFASGDVGVDLFTAAALFALAGELPRSRGLNFFCSGLAVGAAFACKYNGLLVGVAPALFLFLTPRTWRERLTRSLACLTGFALGVLVLTPNLLSHFKTSLERIVANFSYIARYGVPPEFFDQPALQQVRQSLANNLPIFTEQALGRATLLAGVIALVALVVQRWRTPTDPHASWWTALGGMLVLTTGLSLTGKPSTQPFHFSFLVGPVLLLWAGYASQARGRMLPRILGVLILLESFAVQRGEVFFWGRQDTRQLALRMHQDLLKPVAHTRRKNPIYRLALEDASVPVFRNRPYPIRFPGAEPWTRPLPPMPQIPVTLSHDWILLDFPAFPREQRLLALPPETTMSRTLVSGTSLDTVPVLLYPGSRGVSLSVELGGRKSFLYRPGPHQLAVGTRQAVEQTLYGPRHHIPLDVRSLRGSGLLRICASPAEAEAQWEAHQRLFASAQADELRTVLRRARFWEGNGPGPHEIWLTPGMYVIDATGSSEPILLEDMDQPHPALNRQVRSGEAWLQTRTQRLRLSLPGAGDWSLRPEIPDAPPPSATVHTATPSGGRSIRFDRGRITLADLNLPERLPRGTPMSIAPLIATRSPPRPLAEYAVFLHFINEQGQQVHGTDIACAQISDFTQPALPFQIDLPLPPGRYEVMVGIYHPRLQRRLVPAGETNTSKRRVRIGSLEIL